jgi:hypothetical protein
VSLLRCLFTWLVGHTGPVQPSPSDWTAVPFACHMSGALPLSACVSTLCACRTSCLGHLWVCVVGLVMVAARATRGLQWLAHSSVHVCMFQQTLGMVRCRYAGALQGQAVSVQGLESWACRECSWQLVELLMACVHQHYGAALVWGVHAWANLTSSGRANVGCNTIICMTHRDNGCCCSTVVV